MNIMEHGNKIASEDEEEDLEALRLAALQSLKRKNEAANNKLTGDSNENQRFGFKSRRGHMNKRGRFFGNRGSKNGQFNNQPFYNNRARNSNLIAITPIGTDNIENDKKETPKSPKLTLPQDRYCGKVEEESKQTETDKFHRYNNSDVSEDESDEENSIENSDDEKSELKRSDSLEALMQELDDEIQGKPKVKEEKSVVNKVKTKRKIKKISTVSVVSEIVAETSEIVPEVVKNEEKSIVEDEKNDKETVSTSKCDENVKNVDIKAVEKQKFVPHKKFRRSPQRHFKNRNKPFIFQNTPNFAPNPNFIQPIYPTIQPTIIPIGIAPPIFNSSILPVQTAPPFFERPLSPLNIPTETLTTQTMAPLSPRSAAFVLQNRAIIEKRKRSPRRSYSRSPSPRLRRSISKSPRRSLSPRRKSRSPKRRSLSPRRRSMSPKRVKKTVAGNLSNLSKTKNVKVRLGVKNDVKKSAGDKKEVKNDVLKEDKEKIDPVLEARRKKFESNEIKVKEGVIRLKPREDKVENISKSDDSVVKVEKTSEENTNKDSIDEDRLLEDEDFDMDSKEPVLYSDEDSGSENEGRFKTKKGASVKPPILSFSKLLNGVKTEIKETPLDTRRKNSSRIKTIRKRRSSEILSKISIDKKKEENKPKSRIVMKSERHPDAVERSFKRKIEIKIKNPSKYEKLDKKDEIEDQETVLKPERKVDDDPNSDGDDSTEIVIDNESGEENSTQKEGDLRAQLSKKRAEKLQKVLPKDGISSRLLQNALQGAVFKKPKKAKKKDLTNSEGKLPIHMRLGVASASDKFPEAKPKRKSRKRKSKSNEEQV